MLTLLYVILAIVLFEICFRLVRWSNVRAEQFRRKHRLPY